MKKILILTSNPRNDLKLEREIRDLSNVIKRSKNQSQFEVQFELGVSSENLHELLLEHEPRIVHFCGHGTGELGLILENARGEEQTISSEALARLFELFNQSCECVLFNVCYGEVQADAVVQHINYAIGMKQEIRDDAAIAFATGFYRALGWGRTIEESYHFGCNAIQIQLAQGNISRSQKRKHSNTVEFDELDELVIDEFDEEILAEHLKPILKRKLPLTPFPESVTSTNSNNKPDSSIDSALIAQHKEILEQAVKREVERKQYRDRTRSTWDEFGSSNLVEPIPIGKKEYRQRQTLLNKVRDFWIEGFLQPSLYGNNAIDLDWQHNTNAVHNPFKTQDIPVELDESFEQLQTTDILERTGLGKTLLILGEPGSGKTIALLQLAKKALERTETDPTQLIPVVFNLSSWGQKQQPIDSWLIEELREKYQVPLTWSEPWIKQEQLILFLDGLDEVPAAKRDACVSALNQFLTTHNLTEMVVACRVKDYQALTERLQLSSALCIKPLSTEKLYQALNRGGSALAGLKILLQQDPELERFAQTPLILSIMSVAYRDWSLKDLLREFANPQDRYRHLFDSYIERVLRHRVNRSKQQQKDSAQYSPEEVLHWLSWLADKMVDESKTIFLIEKMQPTLLKSRSERQWYRMGNFVLGWLISGLILALIMGPRVWLRKGLITALIGAPAFALIFGLAGGVIAGWSKEITLFEQIKWSWQTAKSRIVRQMGWGLIRGLPFGLFFGLIFVLVMLLAVRLGLTEEPINIGLAGGLRGTLGLGLLGGLAGGLIGAVGSGIDSSEVEQRTVPNQGIWSSIKNSVRVGIVFWLIFGLIFWLISCVIVLLAMLFDLFEASIDDLFYNPIGLLIFVLGFGIIGGMLNGGATGIQHLNLRLILYRHGRIPWNYARFLDYAGDRLLMKKVGGGYIFYHRMLMEHFAQRHQGSRDIVVVTRRPTSQPVTQIARSTNSSGTAVNTVPQPVRSVSNHLVCGNCHHQNPQTGKFCTKCGCQLTKPS